MDENVEKIKRLLEGGYKIIKHQTSFRKEKDQDILEDVVTLKRDDKLQLVIQYQDKEMNDQKKFIGPYFVVFF